MKTNWLVCALVLSMVTPRSFAQQTLGATLRELADSAAASNPVINAPLLPAAAWQANTGYELGQVVVNEARLYICRARGTSAGSGGPSGLGSPGRYADITDGTAKWEYYGEPAVLTPDSKAPVATTVATPPADLTVHVLPWSSGAAATSKFFFAGGTPFLNSNQPGTQVSFRTTRTNPSNTGGNVGLNDGYSSYHWSATFVTDAPKVAIGVNFAPSPVNIVINGRRLYPGGWQGINGGNPGYFVLDFAAAGGRETRNITIEDFGNISFAGVWVDAASAVSAPVIAKPIRVVVFGSSIECGGNAFPLRADLGWPAQVGKRLGWHDVRNLGLGGTGYINNQGGSTLNYGEHLGDAAGIAPDLVIVGGPINDETQPAAQLTTAAVSFLGSVRSALPNVPIVALGTFAAASGPSQLATDSEIAIRRAVTQLGDARTFFVPLITADGGSFINGTGNVGSPNGSGNSDLYISDDGTHPDQPGIDFIAEQYARAIKTVVIDHLDPGAGGGSTSDAGLVVRDGGVDAGVGADAGGSGSLSIAWFTPASGGPGTTVVIAGAGFNGVTGVTFNGVAAVFSVDSATQVTAAVPAQAKSGVIAVTARSGTATSATAFTVTDESSVSSCGCDAGSGSTLGLLLACLTLLQRGLAARTRATNDEH